MNKSIIALSLLILFSCSVQKRKYQKGYFVNWKATPSQKSKTSPALPSKKNIAKYNEASLVQIPKNKIEDVILASVSPKLIFSRHKNHKNVFIKNDSCDILIFKDGSEVKAKIIEISPKEIKYKKCDFVEGPTYTIRKSEVFMIKYSNGTREVIKSDEQAPYTYQNNPPKEKPVFHKMHPFSIVSFVFGVLSFIPLITIFIFPALAILFANLALRKINFQPNLYKGEALAITGKVLGIIVYSIMALILLIFIIALFL